MTRSEEMEERRRIKERYSYLLNLHEEKERNFQRDLDMYGKCRRGINILYLYDSYDIIILRRRLNKKLHDIRDKLEKKEIELLSLYKKLNDMCYYKTKKEIKLLSIKQDSINSIDLSINVICKSKNIEKIPYIISENFIIKNYLFPIIKKRYMISYFPYHLINLIINLIKNDYKIRLLYFKDYFDVKDKVKLGKINYIENNTECMICLETHYINEKDQKERKDVFENCDHDRQTCMKCLDKLRNNKISRCPMCRKEIKYNNLTGGNTSGIFTTSDHDINSLWIDHEYSLANSNIYRRRLNSLAREYWRRQMLELAREHSHEMFNNYLHLSR